MIYFLLAYLFYSYAMYDMMWVVLIVWFLFGGDND